MNSLTNNNSNLATVTPFLRTPAYPTPYGGPMYLFRVFPSACSSPSPSRPSHWPSTWADLFNPSELSPVCFCPPRLATLLFTPSPALLAVFPTPCVAPETVSPRPLVALPTVDPRPPTVLPTVFDTPPTVLPTVSPMLPRSPAISI